MNAFERKVAVHFKKKGWRWLRSGWPDFLFVREMPGGGVELLAVEAKSKYDKLTSEQHMMLTKLATVMPVRVVRQGDI